MHQESLRLEVVVLKTLEVKPRGVGFGGVKRLTGPGREGRRRCILSWHLERLKNGWEQDELFNLNCLVILSICLPRCCSCYNTGFSTRFFELSITTVP